MKIQCDVCNKHEAQVFCTADEAALCDTCDHRVHHANKLASKHQRFSLLHPSAKEFPLCDICREKRAFLFCQQDRAILCRDCDASIHAANEHTQKHDRFLLAGVKLSPNSAPYISSPSRVMNSGDLVPDHKSQQQQQQQQRASTKKSASVIAPVSSDVPNILSSNTEVSSNGIGSTSSLSEYLIETLPGWHVEDFIDPSSAPFGFSKADDSVLPFKVSDFESDLSSFSSESLGIWVSQAPPTPLVHPSVHYQHMGAESGFKMTKEATRNLKPKNSDTRRWADDAFAVPQISPPSVGSKRSRPLW